MTTSILALLAHPDDESFGPGGTLARYAANGVDVHIVIATDGAAGSVEKGYEEQRNELASVRAVELKKAVEILKGHLHTLDYRDSGMAGDPANEHPNAFINADENEAVGRVVRLIREIKPEVVITHDETGGYFHPDHIMCWKITTAAFHAAGDPTRYPEIGPTPFQPQKLYYTAIPKGFVRVMTTIMRIMGRNPKKMGRNKDVDFTRVGYPRSKIHTSIDGRPYWEIKRSASAEHKTQGGGRLFAAFLPHFLLKQLFGYDRFIRAHPVAQDGLRETDLFA
ncbi:MAG: PIG-L deacetylase family protein [Chloroflexota bacterium]